MDLGICNLTKLMNHPAWRGKVNYPRLTIREIELEDILSIYCIQKTTKVGLQGGCGETER